MSSSPMQSFEVLLDVIGLSDKQRSLTVAQGRYQLVYKYDPDSLSLRIILNPEVTAVIRNGTWGATAQVDGHERGPNLVQLGHWTSLFSSGGRTYSRESVWYAELVKCESDLFVRFDHDSDAVTSQVLRTMDVVMASLKGYL
ncbi:hypothetical protein [Desulfocurvus sp. DL9XJH121]